MKKAAIAAALVAVFAIAAAPATTKWVGPAMPLPGGGSAQTTIYYGPWQCRTVWLEACTAKCGTEGRRTMGCIWLADMKTDVKTRFLFMPISWGGKLAVTHCCCDWTRTTPVDRREWANGRERFREEWAQEFGEWPKDTAGSFWDAHHIRDLAHGGTQLGKDNVIPVPKDIHGRYGEVYPECYSGGRWARPGPEYPYAE